jgi:protein-S-isoprenylcysteine O-methyltransferase Ste14
MSGMVVVAVDGGDSIRRAPALAWLVAGYAGLAGFLVLEGVARERGSASGPDDSTDDQGTTRLILGAFGVAAALPLLLRRLRTGRLPRRAGPVGIAMEACGLGLRLWSMRTLQASYTRTLRTTDEQEVIDRGPYRIIRHPGYLGSLLTWTGCTVASGSVPTVTAVACLLAIAYHKRIAAEEELLRRDLPGYTAYAKATKRLIPSVW